MVENITARPILPFAETIAVSLIRKKLIMFETTE